MPEIVMPDAVFGCRPLIKGCPKEGFRVILSGAGENLCGRACLDDTAMLHDNDLVGQSPDHPQVMGDEHIGHGVAPLQILEQFDNLGLYCHVEG